MDNSTDRITELAATISRNTERISSYLEEHKLHPSSFEADASLGLPEELGSARTAVVEAAEEPKLLMLGPKEAIQSEAQDDLVSLHIIVDYGIAKSFPVGQEATFEDIGEACGLGEQEVRRVLRHAMTKHVFGESRKGVVEHTVASKLLAQDAAFADWADVNFGEMWPAAAQTVKAMRKWPRSQRAAESGFSCPRGTNDTLFEYLGKNPERAERFANGMAAFSTGPGYSLDYIVNDPIWTDLGEAVVVYLGGSMGEAMIAIAHQYPRLTAVVQDLPTPISKHLIPPTEIQGRIRFMAHDFFNEQSVKDADVYFFRLVLHNWSDEDCFRILRALVPALKPEARIIVNECCLPDLHTTSILDERRLRSMDMHMLSLLNARERDSDDWAILFRRADPNFHLESIATPRGSNLSIIEGRLEGLS